jgi:hypothetical protein
MAHYAFLDQNNIVTEVIVGKDESNFDWEMQYGMFRGQACKRTSYNTHGGIHYDSNNEPSADQSKAFRKNYAGIGYSYDPQRDAFIPQKPLPSWILDDFSCLWIAPIPKPADEKDYQWDEESQSWIEISE